MMKKPLLIAPRNTAREVLPGPDAERLLASGSWVPVVLPKPRYRSAKTVEAFRQRRREQGFKAIHVLLPEGVYKALHDQRQKGETLAGVIERLLSYAADKSGG
ncbi:hypothetical protein [Pseudogulbenkiania ferrooxidans]|nr:hypothetical protein [Pseudogulbenkiania ferrooxidans]